MIEELLRYTRIVPAVFRQATTDAEILGHHIPKGTIVVCVSNGPSFFSPGYAIDDDLRTASGRQAKGRVGVWDSNDMAEFNPKRWLVDEDGKKSFDATAGPLFSFGQGPRECYGRRMAYLEMKVALTLLVWKFGLQKCPEELSSYDAVDKLTRVPQQCFVRLARI